MKTICWGFFILLSAGVGGLGQTAQPHDPEACGYTAIARRQHSVRWEKVVLETNAQGGAVTLRTNAFVQLAAGLNVWRGGQWVKAVPELLATNQGVLARGAGHAAFFPANLRSEAVSIRLPQDQSDGGGQILRIRPLGLAYHSPSTGTNIFIGEVKDCVPKIIGGEYVVYEDALDSLPATIRFRYTRLL